MDSTAAMVKRLFPARKPWNRKGDFGRLLVVGGSSTYSGAPALAGLAALSAGTDVVTVAAPRRAADIIATFSPSLITVPMRGDFLNSWHLQEALHLAGRHTAVVVGNGMGRRKETDLFLGEFLKGVKLPRVIDADALHLVARERELLANSVLTPHAGEFLALAGAQAPPSIGERQRLVQRVAGELGCTILLKGHVDVISDGERMALNRTGTPFMTKGGTGDTLAGVCGALLARGAQPFEAACAAAWLNGTAGEIAAKTRGEGLLAEHVVEAIPAAIRRAVKG